MINKKHLFNAANVADEWPSQFTEQFHRAANPAAILELLAELEETQATLAQRTAEYEEAHADRLRFACNRLATTTNAEQHQEANSAALLEAAAQACEAKRIEDTGTDSDLGYNRAVRDCAAAVRALAAPSASAPPAASGEE